MSGGGFYETQPTLAKLIRATTHADKLMEGTDIHVGVVPREYGVTLQFSVFGMSSLSGWDWPEFKVLKFVKIQRQMDEKLAEFKTERAKGGFVTEQSLREMRA